MFEGFRRSLQNDRQRFSEVALGGPGRPQEALEGPNEALGSPSKP
jgi:hypothetical protein